jgi:Uma2 family endonuclease
MSSLAHSLVTWTEFLRLPERPENGIRYELHDGEVIQVPPPRPHHIKIQRQIWDLLIALAGKRGVVTIEFPYRPFLNLQYWVADVAYVPRPDWDALPPNDYPIYAPPLIVEVLSPSNTPAKLNRQRIVAMSAGTQEFWVVDAEKRTVQVTDLTGTRTYIGSDPIPVSMFDGLTLTVDRMFAI